MVFVSPSSSLPQDGCCPTPKKARHLGSWEALLEKCVRANANQVGLADLFGSNNAPNQAKNREVPVMEQQQQHSFLGSSTRDGFFTLRMEHREGGAMARHQGEERILLFRSDRAGAIAKIIFSSTPAKSTQNSDTQQQQQQQAEDGEESRLGQMSQAKIHVLDVKEQYRGRDLGGLLFSEATAVLRHRYGHTENASLSSSVRCQLDAEEDTSRYNKLVGFYEQLGCSVKPKAKVQYINNNDGETYRKIPMQIALKSQRCVDPGQEKDPIFCDGSSMDRRLCFLPVRLLEAEGTRVGVAPSRRRVEWLIVDDGEGHIQFRTTQGHCINADPDGRCFAFCGSDYDNGEEPSNTFGKSLPLTDWSKFHLYRVADTEEESRETHHEARRKELWILQSAHGTFLRTDSMTHTLSCSKDPAFWQANNQDLCLTCTVDTPPRRQHYRKSWAKQTVEYVMAMRDRYLGFELKTMGLGEALDMVRAVPCHPFMIDSNDAHCGTSVRTLCFRTAEVARKAGYPDWFQLVALVHELGVVVNRIVTESVSSEHDDFDWTTSCRSRVVGCAAPGRASFGEFRHLNPDEADERYNSRLGMYELHCGLDKVLLTWTGPEYMYHMLRHNSVMIPEEGFAMLRLFSLGDWHTHAEYEHLANVEDEGMRPFVAEFDSLRRSVRHECNNVVEMTDADCDRLWKEHYSNVLTKYGADEDLHW